jgi:hypothetical protein
MKNLQITKHVYKIKENTIHHLRLRKEFLEDTIGEIEEFWEEYGGLDTVLKKSPNSVKVKENRMALVVHNKELTDCINLIKLISK